MSGRKSRAIGRQQLAERASEITGISESDCGKIVGAAIESIVHFLSQGERIELRGFATFTTRMVKGRVYDSLPTMGDSAYEVPQHSRVRIKVAKALAVKVAALKM